MMLNLQNGPYERSETELIKTHLNPDQPVVDLGAGIGYTTCLASSIIADSLPVIAVEADEEMIPVLRDTIRLNGSKVDVLNRAYNPSKEEIKFNQSINFWSSSVYTRDSENTEMLRISTISLENILNKCDIQNPIQLLVDIEGSEHYLIEDEIDVLRRYCSILIIEFHPFTEKGREYYTKKLSSAGFTEVDSHKEVAVFHNNIGTSQSRIRKPS